MANIFTHTIKLYNIFTNFYYYTLTKSEYRNRHIKISRVSTTCYTTQVRTKTIYYSILRSLQQRSIVILFLKSSLAISQEVYLSFTILGVIPENPNHGQNEKFVYKINHAEYRTQDDQRFWRGKSRQLHQDGVIKTVKENFNLYYVTDLDQMHCRSNINKLGS